MRYQSHVTIDAAAADVWRVLADVRRWPEWTPTMRRVEFLDDGPLRVGSRARVEQPRLKPAVWTVTEFVPGRSFAWAADTPGLTAVGDHRVSTGPAGTTVDLVVDLTGWLAPVARALYGRIFQQYVTTEGESLKRICEAG